MADTKKSLHGTLGSLGVALHTQDPTIQRIAAIFISFYGERASTILTTVTLKVEVFIKGHHSDCLLTAWSRNNGLVAAHTERRETPVVILNTIWVVVVICDERCPFKCAGAGDTTETLGMETLAHRFEHTVCDPLPTSGTNCQGIHVAVFTLWCTVPVIELHALQRAMAAQATEAVGMEEFIHGPHCWLRTGQNVTTFPTNICRRRCDDWSMCVHVFDEVLGHSFQFFYFPHVERSTST